MWQQVYSDALIGSALLAAVLAGFFLRRRPAPGAEAQFGLMSAAFVNAVGHLAELHATTPLGFQVANDIEWVAITSVPVFWLMFALKYTWANTWIGRRPHFLAIPPAIFLLLVWTNPYHHLMWSGEYLTTYGSFLVQVKTYGPTFWAHAVYSYGLVVAGSVLLLRRRLPHRRQALVVLAAAMIPLATNVLFVMRAAPTYHVDLTPPAFIISGAIVAACLFRFRMFDIIPIARDHLLEHMADGVIVLDKQERVLDLNRTARQIIGRRSASLLGKPVRVLHSSQPELEALLCGESPGAELWLEGDGERRCFERNVAPINDRQGNPLGRLVTLHDVTARKNAEARTREMELRAQIVSRLASIGELAAGLAHEVNNPLTSIVGYAHLLKTRDTAGEMKEELETITSEAWRAADILKRLLVFSGRYKRKQDTVDVNEVVETTLKLVSYTLRNSNVEVVTDLNSDLPHTTADSGQLQEVCLNLIMNAEAAMSSAHHGGRLVIRSWQVLGHIVVAFTDDGPGISPENIERIFDPFFTTKDVGGEGTGLGLSICHGILREHGGKIYARSEYGHGATFFVELPVRDAAPAATGKAEPAGDIAGHTGGQRILVIDDEVTIRDWLRKTLQGAGYVVETSDGSDAGDRLQLGVFDAALLDIKLKGASGIDLYRDLENVAPKRAERVILMTGDIIGAETARFLANSCVKRIMKPFDLDGLSRVLDELLSGGFSDGDERPSPSY